MSSLTLKLLCLSLVTVVLPVNVFAAANLVLTGGKVVSVDETFAVHEAIAVEDDRILAVGTTSEIEKLASSTATRVDLDGRTVIPGLIDNHAHIMRSAGYWPHEVRLDGITRRADALAMIGRRAEELGAGEWVLTIGGFSPNQFVDDDSPISRAELDSVAPDNPVFMQHLFGMGYANTQAFRAIEIEEDTDIEWLVIANDIDLDANGRPTGTVRGAAMARMLAKLTEPSRDEHRKRAVALNRYLNSMGLTSVLDATGGEPGNPDFDVYTDLAKAGELSLRVFHLYPAPDYEPEQVGRFADLLQGLPVFEDSDYFQRVGVGERLYGPIHDSMLAPAASSEEHKAAFAALARQTAEAGMHLHQHATHIDSINQHLDAFESIAREHDIGALRWTFTHADGIDEPALARARDLGMMIATQSRRLISGRSLVHPLPLIAFSDPPLATMKSSGIRFGLGTDTMVVAQSNPFWTLWWAVTGRAMNAEQLTDQVLTREEALAAHTRDNAWFVFRENDLGAIEPGKLADLLVLDKDYLAVPVDEIRQIRPEVVIVGGRIVYERS